jgi:hypothetical protein
MFADTVQVVRFLFPIKKMFSNDMTLTTKVQYVWSDIWMVSLSLITKII